MFLFKLSTKYQNYLKDSINVKVFILSFFYICIGIWFDIGDTSYCDIKDIEKSLKEYMSDKNVVRSGVYNGDHIHPNSDLNSDYKIVLYGNPASKQLKEFHNKILELVKQNRIVYILRVIPSEIIKDKTELVGYSVFLDIKNISVFIYII